MSQSPVPDLQAALDQAVAALESGELDRAIEILAGHAEEDESGECHAHLGLAYFRKQNYPRAQQHYEKALARKGERSEWRQRRDHARANRLARAELAVPRVEHFAREALFGPPGVKDGALPGPPLPIRRGAFRRIFDAAGLLVGVPLSYFTHFAVRVFGMVFGHKARWWQLWNRKRIWTLWYRRRGFFAVVTLAYMRDLLHRKNLYSSYASDQLVAFQDRDLAPPEGVRHFRTADGSWNNLEDPREGAALTRFPRNVAPAAIRADAGLLDPSPRRVSLELLTRRGETRTVPFLNLLAAAWIQFQTHDWVSHGENQDGHDRIEIPLDDDDPLRRSYHQPTLPVGRTQRDLTREARGQEPASVSFINEVTHWWDGSQLYGSDQKTQERLRAGADGKLRLERGGLLPLDADGAEDTGFRRNWWVGLSLFHTLFAREHNAICDRLKQRYPQWDDNRLFNVARLINAAVMAKIHTVEWTPALLPNPHSTQALNANWFGILTHKLRQPKDRKTRSTLNLRHPELGGVVGNPIDKHGSPYGLSEEFVEVYRLHSLLPESLDLRRHGSGARIREVPLPETRLLGSPRLYDEASLADLFYSFGNQHPGQLVLNNFPRFLQELSIPGHPVVDLGAVDILRARERGVPRYNEFRRQMNLNPIRRFEDLSDDPDEVAALKRVYGEDGVEKLDLLVGTLAEQAPDKRPTGFGFGETLFQIFILNATRRLQADRFFTDSYNEETYTKEGLDWIDDTDLKTVLLRHLPELADTGLANVSNAFEPWDEGRDLDPERHPLRGFEAALQPEPFIGDRSRNARDVVDYRRDPRSKTFRTRLVLHYFHRGVFLRKPRERRVGAEIEMRLRPLTRLPGLGGPIRRRLEGLAAIEVERSDLEVLSGMRMGAGAAWFELGGADTLVLFDRDAIGQVLAASPASFGPGAAKLRGMQVFQPGALTLTSKPEDFRRRRSLAEEVLDFGSRVHRLAPGWLGVVDAEVAQALRAAEPGKLRWADVDSLCQRLALRVALGRWEPAILAKLEELMGDANLYAATDSGLLQMLLRALLARRDARAEGPRGRLGQWWYTARAFADRSSTRREFDQFYSELRQMLKDPDPESLVDLTARSEAMEGEDPAFQIPHWIFALRGTLGVHTIYTLALLAAHPEVQDPLGAELAALGVEGIDAALCAGAPEPGAGLEQLERCILEAGRLWPAVPLIVRQVVADRVELKVGDTPVALRRGQQVLIHNVANNRDEAQVGGDPHCFRPGRWEPRKDRLEPLVVGRSRAATLFSDGPQTCPGRDLALLLVKGILGRLLVDSRYQLAARLDREDLPVSYDQFRIELERRGAA